MKVFARLFQKAAGSKGRALGRLRRGEIFSAFLLVLFFAPAVSKKSTERIFSMLHVLIHFVLFLGYVAARKRTKKNGVIMGRCPKPQSLFEKSDAKTFILREWPVGGSDAKTFILREWPAGGSDAKLFERSFPNLLENI